MSKTKDSSQNMNFTCSYYYKIVKNVSSLSGQWPYQKRRTRLLCLSLVTLNILTIIVPQITKFVACDGNVQCIFQTLTSHSLLLITLVKLYTCYFNRYKIKILIDQLFIDWNRLKTPEEYEIMRKYAENGRRLSLGYSLYCFISVYLFICVSLVPQLLDVILPLNNSRPILMPHPANYFVDEREYFFYIFSHAVVAWEISIIGVVAHDCLLLTYIEHVCSIFAIIGFRFEQLMNTRLNSGKTSHSHPNDIYHKEIVSSVYTHQKALEFTQLIEGAFSLSLIMQIALNTVMISITLLQITQENADILIAGRYVVCVAGLLVHLFCISFEGQKLIDHSLQTRYKIYNSLWYQTSLKSQKMLLFIMQKTLQPISLSAGKIYIFSIENFTTIVQTSMSYFTVLATME